MTLTAVLLLLLSASIHAGWNLVGKSRHPSQMFFLMANGAGTLLLLPIPLYFRSRIELFPPLVWGLLAVTGFFMAVYFIALAGAYRTGHMSIAYPLARSSPILVVTFVTFAMGRGDEVGGLAVIGIVLVVAGCFFLPMRTFRELRPENYLNACCALALLAAIGTAGYTIVDDLALSRLRSLPAGGFSPLEAAFLYLFFQGVSTLAWQTMGLCLIRRKNMSLRLEFASQRKAAVVAGTGIYLAYGLALTSMAFVSNVSYVAAFRQLSIPLGVVFGIVLLREPAYAPKLTGVAMIMSGLIMVGIG